ncbi:GNAT family N-acetyltransferase [Candidatus Enterococcus mansonii]|uniref:N-acetyltransferase domain-containing protein n=1 Tax=Candidatus Enterococcus mansonii TaxID=1834181 RepID=A0A242CJG1_9ENTE|nr:GNAT family N-acetyltransferase [Enterococcus sp. 4G2_DIV0659]OTO09922.1 hypothetical protein A5880_000605 [Enterococcus sp. 4G2_DIV0659]
MEKYVMKVEIPEVDEYLALRKKGGLSKRGKEASAIGLKNSIYSLTIRKEQSGELIGMGRMVGDGGTAYQFVDIVVDPNAQGNGLGKQIVEHLTSYAKESIDPFAYISLIATCPANKLYEKYGFIETSPKSLGMYLKR